MAVVNQYVCDECKAIKRQSNHWFVADPRTTDLVIAGLSPNFSYGEGIKHLCSESCLLKVVSKWAANLPK